MGLAKHDRQQKQKAANCARCLSLRRRKAKAALAVARHSDRSRQVRHAKARQQAARLAGTAGEASRGELREHYHQAPRHSEQRRRRLSVALIGTGSGS